MTSVTLPTNLNVIPYGTFYNCKNLSINIPNSITSIGSEAFASSGITSIIIPNSVTDIGDKTFEGCNQLESVTFGTGLLQLGDQIFARHTPCKVIWLSDYPPTGYEKAIGTINYVSNERFSKIKLEISLSMDLG